MNSDALVLNLLSGLLGALIGAFISLYLYRNSQRNAARQKLLGLVYQLGFQSYWNAGSNNWTLSIQEHYHQLWVLYTELRQWLFPWQRKRLDQAWHSYIRFPEYNDIPDTEFQKIYVKGTYSDNRDVTNACSEFVRFLTKS